VRIFQMLRMAENIRLQNHDDIYLHYDHDRTEKNTLFQNYEKSHLQHGGNT